MEKSLDEGSNPSISTNDVSVRTNRWYEINLKNIDSTYIMSFSGIYDHTVVMFVMSKVMEFTKEEQNRIAMYLINSIKIN